MAATLVIVQVCRAAMSGVTSLLGVLDCCLISLAKPLGAQTRDSRGRYACFISIYVAIYILACLPIRWLPLAALALGYVGILAVARAWSRNENRRTQIARKLLDGNADELPDLRLLSNRSHRGVAGSPKLAFAPKAKSATSLACRRNQLSGTT